MKGNYEPDKFTEADVIRELEQAGKKWKNGHRYILAQCPTHEDSHPSVQIYKDDWFVNCHAGCGRYHITKAFPSLRETQGGGQTTRTSAQRQGFSRSSQPGQTSKDSQSKMSEHKYKQVDLMEFWEKLPEIPADHLFKGVPIDVLHDLGWRYDPNGHRYFIPYFSASRQSIPFAQWRNLGEGPRFNFWKDAKPTCYGTWNLDNDKLFVCEGTSDAAVLDYCMVPWIALPSAASGELMKAMAGYCKQKGIELVYAGDNDAAGDKLREALDEVMPYRVKQPPSKYKDWGEFFEAEGVEAVQNYCFEELFPKELEASITEEVTANDEVSREKTDVEKVQEVFPGAVQLEIEDSPKTESKEQSVGKSSVLY